MTSVLKFWLTKIQSKRRRHEYIYMTKGWTVRDRIPVRTRFSACPDQPWGPPSLLYNGYQFFPRGKVQLAHAADHSPPSSAAVMEEYSYTSTHPLDHTGPVTGSCYLCLLYIYIYIYNVDLRVCTYGRTWLLHNQVHTYFIYLLLYYIIMCCIVSILTSFIFTAVKQIWWIYETRYIMLCYGILCYVMSRHSL